MVIGNRAFWFALSCGLTLLVGGALADYLGAPASVVKASEVNSQGVNTAPTFVVGGGQVAGPYGAKDTTSMAVQSDGRIFMAGTCQVASSYDFCLLRYQADGGLDQSFGTSGRVVSDFGGNEWAYSISIQPDGKVLVAGSQNSNFIVARYLSDGSLDTEFGAGGWVITDFGSSDYASSIVLQPDEKIVVAGGSVPGIKKMDFAIARYLSDGSLDASFGVNGKVTTDFAYENDYGRSVILQPDGKIVVAGARYQRSLAYYDYAVVRYLPNGNLDTEFGDGGKVTTDFSYQHDDGRNVILQPDGKLVVAGLSDNNFGVARYLADGSLDLTFGIGGKVATDFGGPDSAKSIVLQPDGKLLVAGHGDTGTGSGSNPPKLRNPSKKLKFMHEST